MGQEQIALQGLVGIPGDAGLTSESWLKAENVGLEGENAVFC